MKIVILSILSLIAISCSQDKKGILNFQNCTVEYPIYENGAKELHPGHFISNKWELESAKRELAICLCAEYLKKPNKEAKEKIIEIYHENEEYYPKKTPENLDFDTILKNRTEIFNPTKLIE